ncbi:MAG TPA: phosphopantetheine-binding protein, partial [Candidatus Angelobacter sp.]|nr:phosphopantetheine-binding protein [Candidatus Angelobacter sp.]
QPIRGTSIYVLDSDLELAAAGVPGELYISGQGLARGYANNPGLTALSFIANPFGPPGARMYRSGDLVRWRVNGILEFLGRDDRQVKVRGVRIELAEVEAALMRDSRVLEAVATAKDTKLGQQLLAYVVEKPVQQLPPDFEQAHLQEWEELYDSTYAGEKVSLGDFNIVGWNSSYTGKPISSSEMQIWLAESIARIRKLRPRRVAEVGCGTGLLLTLLAPECERYVGVDFSDKAIKQVGAFIAHRREMAHVALYKGFADKLEMIDDRSVDLTIINSVTQYFPSIEYLLRVLNEAVRITADGGHIFVGDVRNAVLLEAFHASTQLDKLPVSTSLHEVRQRVMEACNNEKELLVHPELFLQFCRHHERIGRAEMSVKSGAYDNELSRFRYDVVLTLGPRHALRPPDECLMWDGQGNWHTSVEKLLARSKTATVALRGFPDGRVSASIEAVRILRSAPPGVSTVAQLKKSIVKAKGEDPKVVFEICKRLDVEVSWQGWNECGIYDLLINPRWEPIQEPSPAPSGDFAKYGNTPSKRQQRKKLARILQQQLKESLPDYMVPSAVVVLSSWPVTGSGKIDIKALPTPDAHSAVQRRSPSTAKEATLCSLVADILGRESVDLDESFFALGGDSILSIQLVSRARSAGLAITPGEIFQHPTVAALARIAREDGGCGVTMPAETNGPVLLTPIMRWMLEWSGIPRAFFQAQLLQTPPRLSLHELEMMLQALVDHHEGLRSRLV